jgi:outer membrane receptor protein involved in Fe transport
MAGSRIWRVGLTSMGCAALGASSALAQSASPPTDGPPATQAAPTTPAKPPAKPADKAKAVAPVKPPANGHTVDTITVTGAAPQEVETSIDKKSYTIGKDLAATSGSIADALKDLPSVEVDPQGTLSLRGDPNVTILVDGKPSASFDGAGRVDALQQLPADQIERIEVITNPSAALNPEGSGGVINLITKKSHGSGLTGSAYATVASAGLKREGVNFGYNSPKLAVTGSLAGNYQNNKQHGDTERTALDPGTGAFVNSSEIGIGRNLARGPTARLSVTYTPEDKDQFTGSATDNELVSQGHPDNLYTTDGPDGLPANILRQTAERRGLNLEKSLNAGWRHTFSEGHDLSLDAIYNASEYHNNYLYVSEQLLPEAVLPLEATRNDEGDHHAELRVGYDQRLAGGSLKAGYELKHDDNDLSYIESLGPTQDTLVPVDSLANHFLLHQTINAAFATYEHAFGDLSVQAGLRLEELDLRLAQLTSGQRNGQDYFKVYPSLHFAYKLDDDRKVSASFSSRVQRPPAFLLNPLLQVLDARDVAVGNPELKPEETQSYELGYEQRQGQTTYTATLYYRRKINQINQIESALADGATEYSFGNIGGNQATGLELSANGKLTSTLSYSASTNISWNQINTANLVPNDPSESGYAMGGRLNLNWQATTNDMLQFNASVGPRRLIAQGFILPNYAVNLGWRHKLNDRLTATVTAQDLLASNKFQRRLDTPTFVERFDGLNVTRAVFFRLDYRFGGASAKAAKDPGFEYENGGPGGGPGGPGGR